MHCCPLCTKHLQQYLSAISKQQAACMQVEHGRLTSWLHSLVERTESPSQYGTNTKPFLIQKLFLNLEWILLLPITVPTTIDHLQFNIELFCCRIKGHSICAIQNQMAVVETGFFGGVWNVLMILNWLVESWSWKHSEWIFPTTQFLHNHVEE